MRRHAAGPNTDDAIGGVLPVHPSWCGGPQVDVWPWTWLPERAVRHSVRDPSTTPTRPWSPWWRQKPVWSGGLAIGSAYGIDVVRIVVLLAHLAVKVGAIKIVASAARDENPHALLKSPTLRSASRPPKGVCRPPVDVWVVPKSGQEPREHSLLCTHSLFWAKRTSLAWHSVPRQWSNRRRRLHGTSCRSSTAIASSTSAVSPDL
jgi:hypothetical protein